VRFFFFVKAYYFSADALETSFDLSDINSQLHSISVLLLVDLKQYRSFATTVSELKICDFARETFMGFEML